MTPVGALASLEAAIGFTRAVPDRLPTVINYHSVGVAGGCDSISTAEFRRHIEWLTDRYDVVDLPEVFDGNQPRENAVAITFDDGLASFHRNARPILAEHAVPATVFVPGATVGDDGAGTALTGRETDSETLVRERLQTPDGVMTEAQLRDLRANPLFTIGSHSMTHPRLTEVTDERDLRWEIAGSRERLESALDITVERFAYPYHQYDERVLGIVRESYDCGARNKGRVTLLTGETDRHLIPRLAGGVGLPRLRILLTDTVKRLLRRRRGVSNRTGDR